MSLQYVHAHDSTEKSSDMIWGCKWTARDTVISISADGQLQEWNSSSGQLVRSAPRHQLGLVSLSVSPSGDRALSNSVEGVTKLWNLDSGEVQEYKSSASKAEVEGEAKPVELTAWSVSLNPMPETSGASYAAAGISGSLSIHSAEPEKFGQHLTSILGKRRKFAMTVVHSPDGRKVALGNESGDISIFDLQSNTLEQTFTSHATVVRAVAWSPDSQLLMSGADDKRLVLHDVRTVEGSGQVASLTGHSSWLSSTEFSPDARLAISGSVDSTIKVWDLGVRASVASMPDNGEVWGVSWSPSGQGFVSGGEDGLVKWWRIAGS